MNKVILMGRLTKDPEVRYSQSTEPVAVTKYTLAVNRKFKRDGEPEADFINCVAFGKSGEFAEKYYKKGQLVSVVGKLQVRSWDDQNGQKHWFTEVIIEEQYFAESKNLSDSYHNTSVDENKLKPIEPNTPPSAEGFYPIDKSIEDEDLPF